MIEIKRTCGLSIPKNLPDNILDPIRNYLTRIQRDFQTSTITTHKFYSEGETSILTPRFFDVEKFIPNIKIINNTCEGEDIHVTHNISLRSEIQKKAAKVMLENNEVLIQLEPGVGKTVISIYVICELKKKTIILVHRDSLVEQWKERFTLSKPEINNGLPFTSLNDDDIAVLSSSTFVKDLKKPIIITTVQTFLSLLNRKRKEFLIELNNANIGIMIADEVHTSVGAPTFSNCSIHIPARRIYGLSATPYRYDGNSDIINYHLGPLFQEEDSEGTLSPNVNIILFDYQIVAERRKWIYWAGEFQRSRYLKVLKNSKSFMNLCNTLLTKMINDNRDIIFVAERIKFLESISKICKIESKSLFIAGSTLEELKKQVVFSTPGKIRDGVDRPQKDCLIMTSPISNISQISGRITRSMKDKPTPLIFDIVDIGCIDIARTIFKRVEYYEKKNWNIIYRYITSDGSIKELTNIEVYDLINN